MKPKLVNLDKNRCVFFYSGKSCSNLNSMTGTWQFLETNWQPVFMSENGSGPSNSGTSCKQSCCSRDSKQWVVLSTVGAILKNKKNKRFIELLEKESLELAKFHFKVNYLCLVLNSVHRGPCIYYISFFIWNM